MNLVTTSLGFKRHSSAWASAAARVSVAVNRITDGRMQVSLAEWGARLLLHFVGSAYKYLATERRVPGGAHDGHCRTDCAGRKARARACGPAGHSPDPPSSVHVRLLHRQVAVQRGGGSLCRRWRRLVSRRNLPGQGGRAPPVHRSEERRVGKECRYRWSPYQ